MHAEKQEDTALETNISESQKPSSTPKTSRKGRDKLTEKPEKEKSGKERDKDRERLQSTPTLRPESQVDNKLNSLTHTSSDLTHIRLVHS